MDPIRVHAKFPRIPPGALAAIVRRAALVAICATFIFGVVDVGLGVAAPTHAHPRTVRSRILAYPCTVSALCEQRALYKPRLLTPGSYFTLARLRWTKWGRSSASARTLLYSEFTGGRRITQTRVVFSRPRRMCGVLTFTRWHARTGDGGQMKRSGHKCVFVPSR